MTYFWVQHHAALLSQHPRAHTAIEVVSQELLWMDAGALLTPIKPSTIGSLFSSTKHSSEFGRIPERPWNCQGNTVFDRALLDVRRSAPWATASQKLYISTHSGTALRYMEGT